MKGFVAVSLLFATIEAFARQGPPPLSFPESAVKGEQEAIVLPMTPVEKLLATDAEKESNGPLQVATPVAVDISPATHGNWTVQSDGSQQWQLQFSSAGATDLNFGFDRFHLPAGATLYAVSDTQDYYEGPYSSLDHQVHGQLWLPPVPGDSATLVLSLPADVEPSNLDLHLVQVATGYRDLFGTQGAPKLQKQGSCNIDVACAEANPWQDEVRSVARILIGGSGLCTATMVRDQPGNNRYYLLSAAHCGLSNANAPSLVTFWKFESPSCGALSGGSLAINQTGATFRASRADVDMALLELNTAPPPQAEAYFAGWDNRTNNIPVGSVGIHHPSGDEKAISFNVNPLTTRSSCIGASASNTHWSMVWELGTTEQGSSGSGIWDPNTRRLVGFLSGGTASCANRGGFDCYGRFGIAWNGSSASSRLRDWLDPNATGVTGVSGSEITAPPPAVSLGDAVDNSSLTVSTSGSSNWFVQNSVVMVGDSAVQSGDIANTQITDMQTTVTGPGTLSFYWRVSSEQNFDFLSFSIDGAVQQQISGGVDWIQRQFNIAAGQHTLRWRYSKDGSVSTGADAGWVDGVVFTPTAPPPMNPANGYDFGGDGRAEILLREQMSGNLSMFQMNNNIRTPLNIGSLPLDWKVVGVGDLGGDGNADIVLRRSTGQLGMFEMNNNLPTFRNIGALSNVWKVVGVADLGGDGKADIVLRDSNTGHLFLYQMNNNLVTPLNIGGLGLQWTVVGVKDLGGDGKADIVLRNLVSGQFFLFQMNNNQITPLNIGGLSLAWSVAAMGDTNGDNRADLILRNNADGQLFLFQMNNNLITPFNIGGLPLVWEVVGAADFGGDGRDDILLRNLTGQLFMYQMNNNLVTPLNIGGTALSLTVESPSDNQE